VLRNSATGKTEIKTKFAFFFAENGIGSDIGMNTYVYDILHTVYL